MNIKLLSNQREIKISWLTFMSTYLYMCVYSHIYIYTFYLTLANICFQS